MLVRVEPDRGGADRRERGGVLELAGAEHVVAGREAGERVPRRGRVGRHRRPAGEDGDHGGTGVRREQGAAPEHGVVEVRRDHHQPLELARIDESPLPHRCVRSLPSVARSGSATAGGSHERARSGPFRRRFPRLDASMDGRAR